MVVKPSEKWARIWRVTSWRAVDTVVFVEVKTRAGDRYGGSLAAVTLHKQQQIIRVALDFLVRERILDRPCRFDVVTVDFKEGKPRIEVYPHAFTA